MRANSEAQVKKEVMRWTGEWMRSKRKQCMFTPNQMANMSGLTRHYIYQMENGNLDPKRPTLRRLCEALGVKYSTYLKELAENLEKLGL